MWVKGSPVYFTLPYRILDPSDGTTPVTALVTASFSIQLGDPSSVDRVALVSIAHQTAVPGLYGGSFTPDAAGIWRLAIQNTTYAIDAVQEFEVSASSAYTGGTLTDIASVRQYLGSLSTNYTDAEIQTALDWACAAVETHCNRTFADATYTAETYDGTGTDMLYLKQFPINTVTSVVLDDVTISASDYTKETTGLYYEDIWTKGRRNVTITYNAGYTTIPADLHMVCTRLSADVLQGVGQSATIESEKIGDYQYKLNARATGQEALISAGYAAALAKYRRMVL